MNIETGMIVETMKLGQLAKDVVDAKILEGQCKGKSGWADPVTELYDIENHLRQRALNAIYARDWATVLVYSAMLQARIYNGVDNPNS